MKLSKQIFQEKLNVPSNMDQMSTSDLICGGAFTFFRNPGIPFYLPIGKKIIDNIESIINLEAERLGFDIIDVPLMIKDELLEQGEPMAKSFREKTIHLDGFIKGYHMFTTPEMMIMDLARVSLISHNQLPIRYVYNVEVFRGIRDPSDILKGRQFKTFMGSSLDPSLESLGDSLELFENLTDEMMRKFKIKGYKSRNRNGIDIEYFYFCDQGENLVFQELNKERLKALSLAMVYKYNPPDKFRARFRNSKNKNSKILLATYGLGTQRIFYTIFNEFRDEKGFNLEKCIRPFDLFIIPFNKKYQEKSEQVYWKLKFSNTRVVFDDRENTLWSKKAEFSDYIGVPFKIIVGEEYIIKNREGVVVYNTDDSTELLNILSKLNY